MACAANIHRCKTFGRSRPRWNLLYVHVLREVYFTACRAPVNGLKLVKGDGDWAQHYKPRLHYVHDI